MWCSATCLVKPQHEGTAHVFSQIILRCLQVFYSMCYLAEKSFSDHYFCHLRKGCLLACSFPRHIAYPNTWVMLAKRYRTVKIQTQKMRGCDGWEKQYKETAMPFASCHEEICLKIKSACSLEFSKSSVSYKDPYNFYCKPNLFQTRFARGLHILSWNLGLAIESHQHAVRSDFILVAVS